MYAYRNGDLSPLTAWFVFKKTLRESSFLLLFFVFLGLVDGSGINPNLSLHQNLFMAVLYGPSAFITSIMAAKIMICILLFRPKNRRFEHKLKYIFCVIGIYICIIWPLHTFLIDKPETLMMLYNTTWDFSQLSTLKTGHRLFLKWVIVQIVLLPLLIGDLKKLTFFYGYKMCKEHFWLLMKCQIFSLGFFGVDGVWHGPFGTRAFF